MVRTEPRAPTTRRARRRGTWAFLLAVALALPGSAVGEAKTVPADPDAWCGERYWFKIDAPSGWTTEADPGGETLGLAFRPPKEAEDAPPPVQLTLYLGGFGERRRDIDADEVLEGHMSMLHAFSDLGEIVRLEVPHPRLPTAGVELRGEEKAVALVVVDPESGRGSHFRFLQPLPKRGPERERALAVLAVLVGSLRFDPRRWCGPGPDGGSVTYLEPHRPNAPSREPDEPAEEEAFSLRTAARGCTTLNELFVPIDCGLAEIGGERVFLVRFRNGREEASTLLERHAKRVAAPFCYEALRHPEGAPRLAFMLGETGRAREYRCEPRGWGEELLIPKRGR